MESTFQRNLRFPCKMQIYIPNGPLIYIRFFHATPNLYRKWKGNYDHAAFKKDNTPGKCFVKSFERRTESQKVLDNYLRNNRGGYRTPSEFVERKSKNEKRVYERNVSENVQRGRDRDDMKIAAARYAKSARSKMRRKQSGRSGMADDDIDEYDDDLDEDFERNIESEFIKRWKQKSEWEESMKWAQTDTERRNEDTEKSHKYRKQKMKEKAKAGSSESEAEGPCVRGNYSDRKVLGLPENGPLKLDDIKDAFRSSALKWHPDRHHGSTQGLANEKFKQCLDAYKSLCSAVSSD